MKRLGQVAVVVFPCFFLLLVIDSILTNRDYSFYTLIERFQKYTFPSPYDSIRQAADKINYLNSFTFVNFYNPWQSVDWWNIGQICSAIGSTVSMMADTICYLAKLIYYLFVALANFIGTMLTDVLTFFVVIFGWLS